MNELILIKLGGSVITEKAKEFTARERDISRLAFEIKMSLKKYKGKIILGHGAGSFAHIPAAKYKTIGGLYNMGLKDTVGYRNSLFGTSVVEDAARRLNAIVISKFLAKKLPAFPFSPASFIYSDTKNCVTSYFDPLIEALKVGVIPVVYGDVIMDRKLGCTIFSTEKILSLLAKKLRKKYKIRMIYCTDVDGVYNDMGKVIPKITGKNLKSIKSAILGAKGVDVTGGMLHKVQESLAIAEKYDIDTYIVNGLKKDVLYKSILGTKMGTLISNRN